MRMASAFLVIVGLVGALASDKHAGVSPIQKVIEMLTDMRAKGKAAKQDEQVRFAAFKQFCESTSVEKQKAITSGKEAMEQLDAAITKASADAQELGTQIAGLEADVAGWSDDLKRTRAERDSDSKAFQEAHAEYSSSIDAVTRALGMLEKGPGGKTVPQSLLLQQIRTPGSMFALLQIPKEKVRVRQMITSFMQKIDPSKALLQEAEDEGIFLSQPEGAPQAAAYEGSSAGVIDMVKQLGEKFEDERTALEKRESNAQQAFELMTSDLTAQVANAEDELKSKASTKAGRLEDAAEAKGDLTDTTSSVKEDEKYLADLDAECKQKSFDFQQRQIVRDGEIEAISEAISIMSGDSVSGAGSEHLSLAQRRKRPVLAQLRSSVRSPAQDAAASFLLQKAGELNSRLLSLLASKAGSDPFTKVKKMIQEMITKLIEEGNEEANHKGFCDKEMSTNKQTRDKKTETSETLSADIEEYSADISKLGSEISELSAQIVEIDKAVAEATENRNAEKAKNQDTISDAQLGAQAVGKAIQVLQSFYEKAATPVQQPAPQQGPINYDNRALQILTNAKGGAASASMMQRAAPRSVSLVQTGKGRVPGAPEMEGGAYTGMGNGGVLGLMEVCQSDFTKLEAETSATEAEAAREYEKFMNDSSEDKAVKLTDRTHKQNQKQGKESNLATAKKDLRITQDELHAAMEYYEKLKPDCEAKVLSYAEKVAQRKAEIDSLQEALQILAGDNV